MDSHKQYKFVATSHARARRNALLGLKKGRSSFNLSPQLNQSDQQSATTDRSASKTPIQNIDERNPKRSKKLEQCKPIQETHSSQHPLLNFTSPLSNKKTLDGIGSLGVNLLNRFQTSNTNFASTSQHSNVTETGYVSTNISTNDIPIGFMNTDDSSSDINFDSSSESKVESESISDDDQDEASQMFIYDNNILECLDLSDEELKNLTLIEIEKLLQSNRKSLKNYPSLPYPSDYVTPDLGNRLIYDERNYDPQIEQQIFIELFGSLTDEQRKIFHKIMQALVQQTGGVFFLYGYGGTGKTFMWRTLASKIRSKRNVVLTVASSGIASLLLPGGRTAHSKFKIPVPTFDCSTCNIDKCSDLAELLKQTQLIIWDEAPMAHKYCFEALDKSLRDIMDSDCIFGGKVIIFGGDFRQILPVIPKGSRLDIIHASINASYIWDHCQVLTLTKNMRLQEGETTYEKAELQEFSKWILDIGDGKICEPNDGYAEVPIPYDLLISNFEDPIQAIVQSTYPNLLDNHTNEEFLQQRAILASTIDVVDKLNEYVLQVIPGEEREYLSSDCIDRSEANTPEAFDILTPEFLSSLTTSGLPNHKIKLKVGTPIMLLRNLDQSEGLCNGIRLIVTKLGNHVLQAKIIYGKNIGNQIYIPRMSMSPSQSPWPFKLIRRQFPIVVSYAMTINKSQGQSLDYVGLYLPRPVFSHGQLYVALSRVKSRRGLKILIHDSDKKPQNITTNVVFKEVFGNL